ncbi:MAG: alpha/beta hydrolase, partial [Patescibacteria group bacterium]
PGFGNTEITKQPWTLDDYITFVVDFIQKLNLDVEVLVGHSFGGRIAIKGLATKQLHPKKCILIAAAGIAKKQTGRNVMLSGVAKIGKVITSLPILRAQQHALRKKLYQSIGSDYFAAGSLKETFLNVVKDDLSGYAQQLSLPTLLIWGTDDDQTPLHDGKRLADMIAGSEFKILDHTGHFVHREKAQEVAQLIQHFL